MAYVSYATRFEAKRLAAASAALALAALPALAHAQSAPVTPTLQPIAYSSSTSGHDALAGEDIDGTSAASSPNGAIKTVAPQYGGGYGGGRYHSSDNSKWSHLAFEVGGGLTIPIGNDTNGGFTTDIGNGSNYGSEILGGNPLGGAGWSFSKNFSVLGEVQWDTNKVPGRTLSEIFNQTDAASGYQYSGAGITSFGGNIHTLSVTAEPVYYYFNNDKHSYAGYIIGGAGYYHKSLNFTEPVEEESYYGVYVANQTFASYTDNTWGVNLGTGVSFKPFGQYSRGKLFAEARYTFVDSPRETAAEATNPNSTAFHTGTEELIPITVGLRF